MVKRISIYGGFSMEFYTDFLERIHSFEKRELNIGEEYFRVKASLSQKVDKNNQFQPFFGDTVVFNLYESTKKKVAGIVDKIYEISQNELNVAKISKQIPMQTIKMRSKSIFNMVNTSLVLGLYPVNEEEYGKLMQLYYLFDDVKKLDYPFTPHITLAYYNVDGFDREVAKRLEGIVNELNAKVIEIELDTRELFYQRFVSMNEYTNIVNFAG